MILLKIDAVPKIDQVRHSLNGLLRGNYLKELVVLLTEKLNNVLESAKMIGDTEERLFRYVVFANKSILRSDFFCLLSFFPPKRKPQGLQQRPGVFHTSRITGHPESSATGFNLRIDESNGRR